MAIDSVVQAEMKQQHIVGMSVGIIQHGKVVIAKGYGIANLEQGISASTESVYKIGSVSKQLVATAIMLLIQEDKLALTDTLPQFFKGAPTSWNKITIRQLLNHTSGLPRESPAVNNMREQPDSVVIKGAYKSKLLFEPGTDWRYCNLGYFMLADIIRQRSRQSFANFMQDQVFTKYNLLHTRTTTFSDVVKNRVAGYIYKKGDGIYNATNYLALRPSGAFLSSVNDLLRWEMLIQNNQLLSKRNWEQLWNDKVRISNAGQVPIEYYGYGWEVSEYKRLRIIHHGGTLPGFTSSYFRFIDSNTAIIVLTNADDAYPKTVVLRIADILFKEKAVRSKG